MDGKITMIPICALRYTFSVRYASRYFEICSIFFSQYCRFGDTILYSNKISTISSSHGMTFISIFHYIEQSHPIKIYKHQISYSACALRYLVSKLNCENT